MIERPETTVTDLPALSRRTLIGRAGLAAAALVGVSGCTAYGPGAPASSSPPSAGAGGGTTVPTADIPVGGGKVLPDVSAVVTQPTAGEFRAFSSICTHQNCPVADVTDTINCDCHGSRFSITDGSVVNPPASRPLDPKTVKVDGDRLTVT